MIMEPIYTIASMISEMLSIDLHLRVVHYVLIYAIYKLGNVNVSSIIRWRSRAQ